MVNIVISISISNFFYTLLYFRARGLVLKLCLHALHFARAGVLQRHRLAGLHARGRSLSGGDGPVVENYKKAALSFAICIVFEIF